MTEFDEHILKATAAEMLQKRARSGFFDGTQRTNKYLLYCGAYHRPTGTTLFFTRDAGYHSSGWWKNPDYDQCFHLSLSFHDLETGEIAPKDEVLTREWLDLFFGDNERLLWCEPPAFTEGKTNDTWHYRLFCDEFWRPIKPRGEVYSTEFTEIGWKSFSELAWLQDKQAEEARAE
jgi:hypothetical protein